MRDSLHTDLDSSARRSERSWQDDALSQASLCSYSRSPYSDEGRTSEQTHYAASFADLAPNGQMFSKLMTALRRGGASIHARVLLANRTSGGSLKSADLLDEQDSHAQWFSHQYESRKPPCGKWLKSGREVYSPERIQHAQNR